MEYLVQIVYLIFQLFVAYIKLVYLVNCIKFLMVFLISTFFILIIKFSILFYFVNLMQNSIRHLILQILPEMSEIILPLLLILILGICPIHPFQYFLVIQHWHVLISIDALVIILILLQQHQILSIYQI